MVEVGLVHLRFCCGECLWLTALWVLLLLNVGSGAVYGRGSSGLGGHEGGFDGFDLPFNESVGLGVVGL